MTNIDWEKLLNVYNKDTVKWELKSESSDPITDIYKWQAQYVSNHSALSYASPNTYSITGSMVTWEASPSPKGPSLVRKHQEEFSQRVKCPSCYQIGNISNVIQHLNDHHRMSRENIADWLDTLDSQPIFYPNTCPDDCEKECCVPPKSSLKSNVGPGEYVLNYEDIAKHSISASKLVADSITSANIASYLPQINASTKAISYAIDDISSVFNDFLVTMTKNKPVVEDINLDGYTFPYQLASYNDSWKTEIQFSDKLVQQLSGQQLADVNSILSEALNKEVYYNSDQCTFKFTFEGSHKMCAGVVNKLKEYLNVSQHSGVCTISKCNKPSSPTGYCSKHSSI